MIRSNTFEKRYAILAPFIKDTNVRNNMLNNKDLLAKYERNNSLIKAYVTELSNRFDNETIRKMIIDTIFKLPEELLVSFITSYLNSNEVTKSNSNCLSFYNKTLIYGKEVVKYIEEHGIVSNRDYKNLPTIIIEKKFNDIILKRVITYGGQNVLMMREQLTPQEKSLLVSFIETNNFEVLDVLFSPYYELKKLLAFLNAIGINTNLINRKNLTALGTEKLLILIIKNFSLYGDINLKNNISTLTLMLENERKDLINALIEKDLVDLSYNISNDKIENITIDEMLDQIATSKYVLEKVS
jgi:ABC-type iron transport system FetAB ATPase subunit